MKVKKSELFKLDNPRLETIERSILIAIKNKRDGNFKDFYFKEEKDFIKFLNPLINQGIIVKNQIVIHINEINTEDFSYVDNPKIQTNNYYKLIKFLKDNIVGLIGIVVNIVSLLIKV